MDAFEYDRRMFARLRVHQPRVLWPRGNPMFRSTRYNQLVGPESFNNRTDITERRGSENRPSFALRNSSYFTSGARKKAAMEIVRSDDIAEGETRKADTRKTEKNERNKLK